MVLQFTGLSGAGKTSIAEKLQQLLNSQGLAAEVIDGDKYRQTICKGLGFSREDRCENIRRLGAVAASFSKHGIIAIISAINPYDDVRQELKRLYNARTIWIDCDLQVLIARDTKGLYKRALLPEGHPDRIDNLTGINDTYEAPHDPDLIVCTTQEPLERSVEKVYEFVIMSLSR
ncbi:MAG TPA: adenylyl-sulfate kinase [Chitinophagaceae bacterium]|nr:adenylyl-sulfate kinase [Chitinophagaceae bacterium]